MKYYFIYYFSMLKAVQVLFGNPRNPHFGAMGLMVFTFSIYSIGPLNYLRKALHMSSEIHTYLVLAVVATLAIAGWLLLCYKGVEYSQKIDMKHFHYVLSYLVFAFGYVLIELMRRDII